MNDQKAPGECKKKKKKQTIFNKYLFEHNDAKSMMQFSQAN